MLCEVGNLYSKYKYLNAHPILESIRHADLLDSLKLTHSATLCNSEPSFENLLI